MAVGLSLSLSLFDGIKPEAPGSLSGEASQGVDHQSAAHQQGEPGAQDGHSQRLSFSVQLAAEAGRQLIFCFYFSVRLGPSMGTERKMGPLT